MQAVIKTHTHTEQLLQSAVTEVCVQCDLGFHCNNSRLSSNLMNLIGNTWTSAARFSQDMHERCITLKRLRRAGTRAHNCRSKSRSRSRLINRPRTSVLAGPLHWFEKC